MKKVLILAHMGQMIAQFNKNNIDILRKMNIEVHVAGNFTSSHNTMDIAELNKFKENLVKKGVYVHQINFQRGIGNFISNKIVWKQLNELCNRFKFDLIHCQSPIGGVLGRLVGKKQKIKVIYTAHGFHFFKGGPLKNWIIFYPIEKILSYMTDCLIVINNEDYEIAKKFRKKLQVVKIPGPGINYSKIRKESENVNFKQMRNNIQIPDSAFLLASVGELNENKNHITVLRALAILNDPSIYYIICGIGPQKEKLLEFCRNNNLMKNVRFLGYRNDIPKIYGISNACVFPSKREGLGLAGIEAMATGLPLITSNSGGILEYSESGRTGYVCDSMNAKQFAVAIAKLKLENLKSYSEYNKKLAKKFDHDSVDRIMEQVYCNSI